LIVGVRKHCRRLARYLTEGPWTTHPVVGFVDAAHPAPARPMGLWRQVAVHPQTDPVPILGNVDKLDELVESSRATHLLVALPGRPAHRIRTRLSGLTNGKVRVHWVEAPSAADEIPSQKRWLRARPPQRWRWERLAKRVVDLLGAAIGLILLAPLFLAAGIVIVVTDGWPIFYRQERVGQGGRVFRMWKFRSMRRDAEVTTGPIWASDHDARCTKVGDWLRHTNIDELPQLLNVVWGDMSLVGPRPERPVFVERFRTALPDYDLRHAMPVGMTGWAQVHGWRGRTSLRKRVQYDLDYIQRWSFWLDIQILFMTVEHVLYAKTSWKRRPEP
jgi:exopolysaccharide biosynthesis polyprenyl glycosylphosphotransferase